MWQYCWTCFVQFVASVGNQLPSNRCYKPLKGYSLLESKGCCGRNQKLFHLSVREKEEREGKRLPSQQKLLQGGNEEETGERKGRL